MPQKGPVEAGGKLMYLPYEAYGVAGVAKMGKSFPAYTRLDRLPHPRALKEKIQNTGDQRLRERYGDPDSPEYRDRQRHKFLSDEVLWHLVRALAYEKSRAWFSDHDHWRLVEPHEWNDQSAVYGLLCTDLLSHYRNAGPPSQLLLIEKEGLDDWFFAGKKSPQSAKPNMPDKRGPGYPGIPLATARRILNELVATGFFDMKDEHRRYNASREIVRRYQMLEPGITTKPESIARSLRSEFRILEARLKAQQPGETLG
jgi:hypothetical protein